MSEYLCPECGSDNILCKLEPSKIDPERAIFSLVHCDNCDHWFTPEENDAIVGPIPSDLLRMGKKET